MKKFIEALNEAKEEVKNGNITKEDFLQDVKKGCNSLKDYAKELQELYNKDKNELSVQELNDLLEIKKRMIEIEETDDEIYKDENIIVFKGITELDQEFEYNKKLINVFVDLYKVCISSSFLPENKIDIIKDIWSL